MRNSILVAAIVACALLDSGWAVALWGRNAEAAFPRFVPIASKERCTRLTRKLSSLLARPPRSDRAPQRIPSGGCGTVSRGAPDLGIAIGLECSDLLCPRRTVADNFRAAAGGTPRARIEAARGVRAR